MKKMLIPVSAIIFVAVGVSQLVSAGDFIKIENLRVGETIGWFPTGLGGAFWRHGACGARRGDWVADFNTNISIKDVELTAEPVAPVAPVSPVAPISPVTPVTPQVPQDLIYKFQRVRNDLQKLESDTTWVRSDINRLEREARRIQQSNTQNHFFESDLRRTSYDMSRYANDAQRISMDVRNLLNLAQKSDQLNRIARDMEWDARDLLNRAQFDIENAARQLEWATRPVDPKIIGYNAKWLVMDISRYSRDLSWRARDISYDAQTLVNRTQP